MTHTPATDWYDPTLLSVLHEDTKAAAKTVDDTLDGIEGMFGHDRLHVSDAALLAGLLRTLADLVERDAAPVGAAE